MVVKWSYTVVLKGDSVNGAAGLAAAMTFRDQFAGQTVAVVLCGGNLTPEQMGEWLG